MPSINLSSPSFWGTLAGIVSITLGAVDPTGKLGTAVQSLIIGFGAVIIWIVQHHNTKAEVTVKSATKLAAIAKSNNPSAGTQLTPSNPSPFVSQ